MLLPTHETKRMRSCYCSCAACMLSLPKSFKPLLRPTTLHGMQDEGNPLSLLASMSSWAQQAQTALFSLGAPLNADGTPASESGLKSCEPQTPTL